MDKKQSILIIDDEPDIIEVISFSLEKEGYSVLKAGNGKAGIELALKHKPNLIILDVMMPEIDGIEVCRELRQTPELNNTLIIFLSARGEDYSQIAGLDAGGDDYLTKPIRPRVLTARVKALLRRNNIPINNDKIIELGSIKINKETFQAFKDEQPIDLAKKEFQLLEFLTSRPGRVFPRAEILNTVWGTDLIVGDRTIDVHIRKLREKLGDNCIKTVRGIGYKFIV